MTLAEPVTRPLFGQITIEQMRNDERMTRTVLSVVKEACKHSKGRFTVESVANGLADGSMLLFGVVRAPEAKLEATVVTQTRDGVFDILLAGPDFEDVAQFMDILEKFARGARCERMQLYGPTFFRNHLPAGWFAREVRYERLLSDAR